MGFQPPLCSQKYPSAGQVEKTSPPNPLHRRELKQLHSTRTVQSREGALSESPPTSCSSLADSYPPDRRPPPRPNTRLGIIPLLPGPRDTIRVPDSRGCPPSGLPQTKQPPVLFHFETTAYSGGHKRPIKNFLNPMYVFARDLTCKVQSINFACTDFWSLYLVQTGAEIRVSVADVDTDSLLSQNWPPSTLVRHGS